MISMMMSMLYLEEKNSTEEFKAKAKTIFETALKTKVAEVRKLLEQQYEKNLERRLSKQKKLSLREWTHT